jgi:hypothetical protein
MPVEEEKYFKRRKKIPAIEDWRANLARRSNAWLKIFFEDQAVQTSQ